MNVGLSTLQNIHLFQQLEKILETPIFHLQAVLKENS